jgi:vitamin B12 transporter
MSLIPRRLCILAALSLAATTSFAQADTEARIVITAARAEQSLADALPSTRVITRADIEASAATDLPALLRTLTSIDVAQTGPLGSQASLFLRGADSRQTLVLLDGLPLLRADFGTPSWQQVPIDQIERIEIVRGNLSALYGAQAVGGVVQIVMRRAAEPQVTLGVGSQGSRQAAAAGSTLLGSGHTATRLSASFSWRQTDGYSARDPVADPSANPDRDGAQQDSVTARLEQGWAPGQRTEVTLTSTHTRSDYDGFAPGLHDVLTTRLQAVGVKSRHAMSPSIEMDLELGQTLERFDDPTGFATEGRNRVQQGALQLAWTPSPANAWQWAIESRRESFSDSSTPTHDRRTNGVRAAWTGRPTDGWQTQAAFRSDDSSDFGRVTTGLLALAWLPSADWKLSMQAATGFSAPSFVDQVFANPSSPLQPERSRQVEVAAQWTRGAALARLAAFAQWQRDRIAFDPVTFETVNIARAHNHGIEAMVQWPLGPGLLGLDLTRQDPRDATTGQALKRRARENVALHYGAPFVGWQWAGALRYTGPRLDTDPVSFADAMTPSRTTLDLSATRALSSQWRLVARLANVNGSRAPEVLGYTPAPRSAMFTLQGTLR